MKIRSIILLTFILLIIIPFSITDNNDEIKAKALESSTVGYYQSTTCNISLFEFLTENTLTDKNFYFNNNNYSDINCFGKITGVDLNKDNFFISVGTNTSLSLLIQSSLWFLVIILIPKHEVGKNINIYLVIFLPVLFCLQLFSEERFYTRTNILFNNEISLNNFYILGNFITYLLFGFISFEILKSRYKNLINYIPFTFLFVGTFLGMNLNFYLIILSYFGINYLYNNSINKYDLIYVVFSLIWIFNIESNDYFFDGDKLRGFINSNLNLYSQIFWLSVFYLIIKGIIFLVEEGVKSFSEVVFLRNLLISSSLIVLFGVLGSYYPIVNFYNFLIFGQNKRGMRTIESIAGNTWRGFSASAESIGEFFGFVVLFLFLIYFFKKELLNYKYYLLLIPIFFGFYKSNNFASILSLFIIISFVLIQNFALKKVSVKTFWSILVFLILVIPSIFVLNSDYNYFSSELLFESTLHQGFYDNPGSYENYLVLEKKMYERDLKTILLLSQNKLEASTSYIFLVNIFTNNLNIPLLPNIVAVISFISLLINRTEMWGIFIAKYDPNLIEGFFGSGPLQINKYLYSENVYLDVPKEKINSLFLPHSSFLDYLIFIGFGGVIIILFYIFRKLVSTNKNNMFKYLIIFLFVNLLKSDSILYLNFFILFLTCLFLSSRLQKNTRYEE
tara:strand:+ start:3210 stop:5234 length:2025 start_codon:yes stop_codon:yes gene_type:complete